MNIYEDLNKQLKHFLEGEVVSFADYKKQKSRDKIRKELLADLEKELADDLEKENIDREELYKEEPKEHGKELPAKNYKKSPMDIEVGDILVREWGWSMRLVDYYRVISRTKSSIRVERLEGKRITEDGWQGDEVPTDKVIKDEDVDGKTFRIIPPEKQYYQDVNLQAVCRINGSLVEFWDGKPKDFDTLD